MSIKKESSHAATAEGTIHSSMSNSSTARNESKDEIEKIAADVVYDVVAQYEAEGVVGEAVPLRDAASRIVAETEHRLELIKADATASQKNRLKYQGLTEPQAAKLVVMTRIVRLVCTKENVLRANPRGVLAMYVTDGPRAGIYRQLESGEVNRMATELKGGGVSSAWKAEFAKQLLDIASMDEYRVAECTESNLVFMNNGIFDYSSKTLMDFDPAYVSLRKHAVALSDVSPEEPVHVMPDGSELTFTAWLKSLVPYDGGPELLIKLAGAALRDRYNWRVMVTIFNKTGHNGKSTFLDCLKAMVGPDGVMTSTLANLAGNSDGGRFGVSNIVGVSLITCEDSDSGAYIRDNSRLKSIISHDTISVENKGENAFDYQPHALIVAAANDLPKTKDKGRAWLDRNIYVPFTGEFRGQIDDKRIREEWVVSSEFGEYLAYRALVACDDYWSLPEPPEVMALKEEFILENDPVVEFWNDIKACKADFFPSSWLWEEYRTWLLDARPNTKLMTKASFTKRINEVALDDGEWMRTKNPLTVSVWAPKLSVHGTDTSKRERGLIRAKAFTWFDSHSTTPLAMGDEYQKWRVEQGFSSPDEE